MTNTVTDIKPGREKSPVPMEKAQCKCVCKREVITPYVHETPPAMSKQHEWSKHLDRQITRRIYTDAGKLPSLS